MSKFLHRKKKYYENIEYVYIHVYIHLEIENREKRCIMVIPWTKRKVEKEKNEKKKWRDSLFVAGTGHLAEWSFIESIYPVSSLQWRNHSRGNSWSFWLIADKINHDHDQKESEQTWSLCSCFILQQEKSKSQL